jgi:hypothetical protein
MKPEWDSQKADSNKTVNDDMLPEYNFNYRKAKPNRFALRDDQRVIILDPDVAEYFKDSESVNRILRALIGNMPQVA